MCMSPEVKHHASCAALSWCGDSAFRCLGIFMHGHTGIEPGVPTGVWSQIHPKSVVFSTGLVSQWSGVLLQETPMYIQCTTTIIVETSDTIVDWWLANFFDRCFCYIFLISWRRAVSYIYIYVLDCFGSISNWIACFHCLWLSLAVILWMVTLPSVFEFHENGTWSGIPMRSLRFITAFPSDEVKYVPVVALILLLALLPLVFEGMARRQSCPTRFEGFEGFEPSLGRCWKV